MSGEVPIFKSREQLDEWVAAERLEIAEQIKWAPAWASYIGEDRIRRTLAANKETEDARE